MTTGSRSRRAYTFTVWMLSRIFGERQWSRFYHGHGAVLMQRSAEIPAEERTRWSTLYYTEGLTSCVESPVS